MCLCACVPVSVPSACRCRLLCSHQAFVKTVNYNHMMPTRYTLDVDLKTVVSSEALENSTKKVEAKKVRRQAGRQAGTAMEMDHFFKEVGSTLYFDRGESTCRDLG